MKNLIIAFLCLISVFFFFSCSHSHYLSFQANPSGDYKYRHYQSNESDAEHIFYYKGLKLDDRITYYGTASWMCH